MKNVTVTMDEAILQRARVAAVRDGRSLSRFIAEAVEQRVGKPLTQLEALDQFLAGPSLDLLDEDGRASRRAQLYDE